jgi:toluene monooxygenase electron transfer component
MASFNIKISEQEFEFKCEEGDTFLRAALRAGLGLPYECNSGGGGSCKV